MKLKYWAITKYRSAVQFWSQRVPSRALAFLNVLLIHSGDQHGGLRVDAAGHREMLQPVFNA